MKNEFSIPVDIIFQGDSLNASHQCIKCENQTKENISQYLSNNQEKVLQRKENNLFTGMQYRKYNFENSSNEIEIISERKTLDRDISRIILENYNYQTSDIKIQNYQNKNISNFKVFKALAWIFHFFLSRKKNILIKKLIKEDAEYVISQLVRFYKPIYEKYKYNQNEMKFPENCPHIGKYYESDIWNKVIILLSEIENSIRLIPEEIIKLVKEFKYRYLINVEFKHKHSFNLFALFLSYLIYIKIIVNDFLYEEKSLM